MTRIPESDIPSDILKKYQYIGKGISSYVFDYGENTVLMITCDRLKMFWLTDKEGLGVGALETRLALKPGLYTIKLPKYHRIPKREGKMFSHGMSYLQRMLPFELAGKDRLNKIKKLISEFESAPFFLQLLSFLKVHYKTQCIIDVGVQNIMKDEFGDYIWIDPFDSIGD